MNVKSRAQVTSRLHKRAREIVVGFSAELPPYPQVPTAMVETDFARGVQANIDLFLQVWKTGTLPTAEETSEVVELAVTRAREGVPLATILGYYRIAATFIWAELERSATKAESEVLCAAAPLLMQYVAVITEHVAVACVGHVGDPLWEQREHRRAVADALLRGMDPGEHRFEAAVSVAKSFLVTVFAFDDQCSPNTVSQLRGRIDRLPGALLRMDGQGWVALIPLVDADAGDGAVTAARLQAQLVRPDQPAVAGMWIGAAPAVKFADIPGAAEDARVMSRICRKLNRSGVIRPSEMLLEFAMTAGPRAHPLLAGIAETLRAQPILAETVTAFVECGFNQLAAARRLHVHRNTVNYRLSTVAALTGYDPSRTCDAMVLLAAWLVPSLAD